jgi:hypothetical protein
MPAVETRGGSYALVYLGPREGPHANEYMVALTFNCPACAALTLQTLRNDGR